MVAFWGCLHLSSAENRRPGTTVATARIPAVSPGYTRRTESTNGVVALEVALRRFVSPRSRQLPTSIWLVGVTHLGTSNYYARIQRFLDAQEFVLFEGIGATNRNFHALEGNGFSLQPALAKALHLRFQLTSVDYDHTNWINSDLGIRDLERHLPSDGKSVGMDQLMAVFQGEGAFGGVARLGVALLGSSSYLQAMAKLMLIETLGGFDGALPEGMDFGIDTEKLMRVLIEERNAVVIRDLRRLLKRNPRPRSVAVFYGAGHMPDLEKRLKRDLGLKSAEEQWFRAFGVDPGRAGLSEAEVEAIRSSIQSELKRK